MDLDDRGIDIQPIEPLSFDGEHEIHAGLDWAMGMVLPHVDISTVPPEQKGYSPMCLSYASLTALATFHSRSNLYFLHPCIMRCPFLAAFNPFDTGRSMGIRASDGGPRDVLRIKLIMKGYIDIDLKIRS